MTDVTHSDLTDKVVFVVCGHQEVASLLGIVCFYDFRNQQAQQGKAPDNFARHSCDTNNSCDVHIAMWDTIEYVLHPHLQSVYIVTCLHRNLCSTTGTS